MKISLDMDEIKRVLSRHIKDNLGYDIHEGDVEFDVFDNEEETVLFGSIESTFYVETK